MVEREWHWKEDHTQYAHMRIVLHFMFDETKKMFLVHAARVVHVRIDFPQVIKVTGDDWIKLWTRCTLRITNRCGTRCKIEVSSKTNALRMYTLSCQLVPGTRSGDCT